MSDCNNIVHFPLLCSSAVVTFRDENLMQDVRAVQALPSGNVCETVKILEGGKKKNQKDDPLEYIPVVNVM